MLNNVWKSSQYSTETKPEPELRTFHLTVQLRMLEMTASDLNQLSTFHTKNRRRILRIFWPETISNQHLLARCNQDSMGTIIMRRRWRWIGHVIRREPGNISRTALHWTPEGKRKRGRPKNTWCRTVEGELTTLHHTWGTVQKQGQNRQGWSTFVAALHASRHNGHE